jgi:hypothetical protein
MRLFLFVSIVFWFTVLGPLVGGLPWNALIFPIPIAYVIGAGPAALAGALYATLMIARRRSYSGAAAFIRGATCGAAATLVPVIYVLVWTGYAENLGPRIAIGSGYEHSVHAALIYVSLIPLLTGALLCVLGAAAGGTCAYLLPKWMRGD